MLPAWATVALALGGAFLTALASIGVAYLTKKQESVAEWRKLLVDAGENFSTGVGQATRAVREAIRCFNEDRDPALDEHGNATGPHEAAVREAVRSVNEASDRLARVLLLYGPDTRAGAPAAKAIELLRTAAKGLRGYLEGFLDPRADPDDQYLRSASGACTAAERYHDEFNRMARNAMPGRPYRFLGAFRD
jgi:hypothetical protein